MTGRCVVPTRQGPRHAALLPLPIAGYRFENRYRHEKRGTDIMDTWLEMEGEKLLPRFQSKLDDIRRGFAFLEQQPTKVDIVVSHGLTIATSVWATNNPEKFKNAEYKITMDDLKEILK